jgi:hypothetical protein
VTRSYRTAIGLSAATTLLALTGYADARAIGVEVVPPCISSARSHGSVERSDPQALAQTQIADAAGCLQQASLQWDFASNADLLALLRKAQGHLVVAARQLRGPRRIRTDDLLADLNRAIERTSTQIGTPIAPGGPAYGPRPPDHGDLARLAAEGQDLERRASPAQRLLVTDDVGAAAQDASPAHRDIQQADFAMANSDVTSWPPDMQVHWPEVHFKF